MKLRRYNAFLMILLGLNWLGFTVEGVLAMMHHEAIPWGVVAYMGLTGLTMMASGALLLTDQRG